MTDNVLSVTAFPNNPEYDKFYSEETAHTWVSSGKTLKSTMKCYNGASANCTTAAFSLPITQIATTTTIDSLQPSKTVQFINSNGLTAELDEYDYGASTPTRKTVTAYASLGNNILDRPSSVTVSNAAGSTVSQTQYSYDDFTLGSSGVTGSSLQPVTGSRGNQTTATSMASATVSTYMHYDNAGQVAYSLDGNNHMTTYAYDATDTYVTLKTYPTVAAGSFSESYTPDANTGLIVQSKDVNGQLTGYSYDSMLRQTGVCRPDGGYTQTSYPSTSIAVGILQGTGTGCTIGSGAPSGAYGTTTYSLDGYGRVIHKSDPVGNTIDMGYDSRGRVASVSNPHASTSSPTDGTVSYTYDALSRLIQQTNQDNSHQYWCYDGIAYAAQPNCIANASRAVTGSWADFTDEAENHWQRVSDGLGRLTAVMEPNSANAATIETDYGYDALNNLSSVNQTGVSGETAVARSFSYDGLSRLLTATNAESGTTTYTYDGNGNVMTKTDARGSAAGAVWYCYDAWNRLTGKAYSSQSCPLTAPAVTYSYDSSSVAGNQNPVGRLTNEQVFSGSTLLTQRQPYNYDAMGRLRGEQQCALGNCSGTPYTLSYTYDLAGNQLTSTNGVTSPQAQLTYCYDAGGRINLVTSSLNTAPNYPPTLFSASGSSTSPCATSSSLQAYNPANQLQYAQIGVGAQQTAITLTRSYDSRLRPTQETDAGQVLTPGVAASATVTISGAEQSIGAGGTPTQATGTISLSYSGGALVKDGASPSRVQPLLVGSSITLPDGYHAAFVASTNSALATANSLAAVLNAASSPVTAVVASGGSASAASMTLTTKATGADQNGAITLSLAATQVKAAPASLSGGAGTTYDTGTVTANINGTAVTTSYGQSSTPQTIAAALATAISGAGASVAATSTSGAITVTAMQAGTAANGWAVTLSSATNESKFFSSASFSGTSGTLSGGENGSATPGTIYSYTIGSSGATGYAANGNLASYIDSINGGWSLAYDHVNRVSTAVATSGAWNNLTLSWTYDSFGNRTAQTPGGQNIVAPVPQAQTLNYPGQNRISNYSAGGYDAAGNVTYDLINNYLYDPEGRLCAASYVSGTMTEYMLYLYDGEGRRVAKVSNPTFSCTPGTGSTLMETYLLGPSGEHISELGQGGAFLRSNVYANGQLLATYTNSTTYFALNDWLGSKRVVTNYAGSVAQMCMNLPFGDELICSANDVNEQHFTGQIHDHETGNDYFNARYYSNNTGRFLSPDFSESGDDPDAVPYADYSNPQSLNLYAYVNNNPLTNIDSDGHGCQTATYTAYDSQGNVTDTFTDVDTSTCLTGLDVILNELGQAASNLSSTAKQAGASVLQYLSAPRNMGCLASATSGGAAAFAGTGAVVGAVGGLGVFDEVTIPAGAGTGFLVGGTAGFTAGFNACMTGTGSGGGSGGGGGGGKVRFGNNANQDYHAFRHVEEEGINRQAAEDAIRNDLAGKEDALPQGLTKGEVNVGLKTLDYNAYKFPDGTINVGRITVR